MSDYFRSEREKCLREGVYYQDPQFPPTMSSISSSGRPPPGSRRIIWKRPWEIVKYPQFIVQGARRFDLDQGYLGDCWFIVASSLIALHETLLVRCVPRDQGFGKDTYAGIFHFNFWWYGKWTEVIIDDFLPTDGNGLIYASNREEPTEFWPALLEKAYAKLNGTYQDLSGGRVARGLIDLTGGMSETVDLQNKADIPQDLFGTLLKSWKMNSLFGCSISLPPNATSPQVKLVNGLYMGHAYAINSLAEVRYEGKNLQLCRLRNPWGRSEWNGDWSDNSPQVTSLSEESKKMLGIVIQDEGEFWMTFQDLVEQFEEIEICHLQPDALTSEIAAMNNDPVQKRQWNVTVYHDGWIHGITAGGCGNPPNQDLYWKNPQFAITLKDVDETDNRNLCTMIVSLMDKAKGDKQIAIGFDIYKLKDPQRIPLDNVSAPRNALILKKRSGVYKYTHEVNRRFELPPGIYVIIPSTFNPNEEAEFVLRIFTEKLIESSVLDEEIGPPVRPVPKPVDPVQEIFMRCAGEDGKLYAKELKRFLAEMSTAEFKEPLKFSSEACRSLITLVDKTRSGQLNLEGAREVWNLVLNRKAVFEQFDRDGSRSVDTFELQKMFTTLGFPISRNVLTAVVRRYGGRNKKIKLTDFIIVISKLTLMFEIFKDKLQETGDTEFAKFNMNEFLYYTMYC